MLISVAWLLNIRRMHDNFLSGTDLQGDCHAVKNDSTIDFGRCVHQVEATSARD